MSWSVASVSMDRVGGSALPSERVHFYLLTFLFCGNCGRGDQERKSMVILRWFPLKSRLLLTLVSNLLHFVLQSVLTLKLVSERL